MCVCVCVFSFRTVEKCTLYEKTMTRRDWHKGKNWKKTKLKMMTRSQREEQRRHKKG